MADARRMTVDGGETLRYAEYTSKTNVRSDAGIDSRLVSVCFQTEDIHWVNLNETLRVLPVNVCDVTSMTAKRTAASHYFKLASWSTFVLDVG